MFGVRFEVWIKSKILWDENVPFSVLVDDRIFGSRECLVKILTKLCLNSFKSEKATGGFFILDDFMLGKSRRVSSFFDYDVWTI